MSLLSYTPNVYPDVRTLERVWKIIPAICTHKKDESTENVWFVFFLFHIGCRLFPSIRTFRMFLHGFFRKSLCVWSFHRRNFRWSWIPLWMSRWMQPEHPNSDTGAYFLPPGNPLLILFSVHFSVLHSSIFLSVKKSGNQIKRRWGYIRDGLSLLAYYPHHMVLPYGPG